MTVLIEDAIPDVSVLLTSWNTREDTRRCLESLYATAANIRYEVIAVDNGSRDGSAELLAADPRVHLIANQTNVGFAPAVNQAYLKARGDLILLLNSDVQFHPGSLQTMVSFLSDRPDASGVSPLYLNPDGSFQQHYVQLPGLAACMALWTVLKRAPYFRGALQRFQMKDEDFSKPRQVASGSCMLMRASAFRQDRIFDESFPIYWNDAILTRELQSAGHHMWMIPSAVVTHSRGASCRLLGPAIRFRHLLGGMVCYLRITQPSYRVTLFRFVLTADYLVKTMLGRTTTLGWRDLQAALRGDVGPLPDGDTRDWDIMAGSVADLPATDDVRQLLVAEIGASDAAGTSPRRFSVQQIAPSVWRAHLPKTVPCAGWLPPARWLNNRLAAARLRQWLDRHAGVRRLRVDDDGSYLIGWLGEDVPTSFDPELVHD
jgi:GT2 family glycosyltransferase